ncbi:hypothetical protein B0T12DRAFT_36655 [Alternaria alternata]|nr:hypothetical protein B0T12DRAFT_36655 [Alternaria alternata]
MPANLTHAVTTTETDESWSKEAILAMTSLLVMVLLSGMGMICKSRMKGSGFWRHRWGSMPTNDQELVIVRTRSNTIDWVDIADVRRYQQNTYTSILRMRRGSSLSNTSSQRTTYGRDGRR